MKLSELNTEGQTGGQTHTFCPLCHSKRRHQSNKSLSVNLDDGVYTCHNCGAKGRLEEFRGMDYVAKDTKTYRAPDAQSLKARSEELDPLVLDYFAARGISAATLEDWGVTYGMSFKEHNEYGKPKYVDGVPQYLRGIRFPYFEDGNLVNIKHLRPREWQPDGERLFESFKDGKPVPFGLDRPGTTLVIVEGEIDALSITEALGAEVAVWSVPNGAKNINWLDFEGVVKRLLKFEKVIIAVDTDTDGLRLKSELVRRLKELLGVERLATIDWPEGYKDANDVLKILGPEDLTRIVLHEAAEIPIDGISEVSRVH
jgi:twinkle protein